MLRITKCMMDLQRNGKIEMRTEWFHAMNLIRIAFEKILVEITL